MLEDNHDAFSDSNNDNEDGLVVKCCDFSRQGPLRCLIGATIPGADHFSSGRWASIVNTERRAEDVLWLQLKIRTDSGATFFQITHFQSQIVGNVDQEAKDAFDLLQSGTACSTKDH